MEAVRCLKRYVAREVYGFPPHEKIELTTHRSIELGHEEFLTSVAHRQSGPLAPGHDTQEGQASLCRDGGCCASGSLLKNAPHQGCIDVECRGTGEQGSDGCFPCKKPVGNPGWVAAVRGVAVALAMTALGAGVLTGRSSAASARAGISSYDVFGLSCPTGSTNETGCIAPAEALSGDGSGVPPMLIQDTNGHWTPTFGPRPPEELPDVRVVDLAGPGPKEPT